MAENDNVLAWRTACEVCQQIGECVTGVGRRFLVGNVAGDIRLRGPGKYQRHTIQIGIGCHLRCPEKRFLIAVIIAMHEKRDLLAGAGDISEVIVKTSLAQHLRLRDDKILLRVGFAGRPLNFSTLVGGRYRNVEAGIIRFGRSERTEALFGLLAFFARACHIGGHDFGILRPGVDRLQHVRSRPSGAGGKKTEHDKKRQEETHGRVTGDNEPAINSRPLKKLPLLNNSHGFGARQ